MNLGSSPAFSFSIPPPRGYSVDELEDHISQLHEYNDIKDVGQMLLGKLGERRDSREQTGLEESLLPIGGWIFLLGYCLFVCFLLKFLLID